MKRNPEVEELIKRALWWVGGAILAGVVVTLAAGCASRSPAGLTLTTVEVEGHKLKVEVASEPEQRMRGLMYRRELGEDEGMLFVYEQAELLSFWMKNTFVPLSIAFIDDQQTIIHIAEMTPQTLKSHQSPTAVRFALETRRGWFKSRGLGVGTKVQFTLAEP
ncbi:MAG: hypothetical protein CMP23_12050 [Rickettsiales bacterium]|nr:hypothetical protein [Rickettsiales bacterium]